MGAEFRPSTPHPFSLASPQPISSARAASDPVKGSLAASDGERELQMTARVPKAVSWGETASVSLEVVSIKGKAGGSPVELTLDPPSPALLAAGIDFVVQGCAM